MRASRRRSNARLSWILGGVEAARRVERVNPGVEALRGATIGRDLGFEAERRQVARIVETVEEVARELVRLGGDRGQVGDVVLIAALLAGVEAASDPEDDQDQEHHQHGDARRAAGHDLPLPVGLAAMRRSATAGFG